MTSAEKFKQYLFVIQQLTSREIKRRYARSYLGIIWSVLNPLLSMAVLSLIFSQLFARSIENYPIYYLSGYILWQAFTGSTNAAMTTLVDNKALLLKVKFPLNVFIFARVYTSLVNLLYSLAAYAVMLVVFKVFPTSSALICPVIILLLFFFSLGISYILSTAYVFFGDIKHLYTVFLTLWMYCSAIFYPAEQLKGFIYNVILLNPMYTYINCFRKAVMYSALPSAWELFYMIIWSAALFAAGSLIFAKNKNAVMLKI